MPIVCTAIIGQQNNPLYLRTFPSASPEQILKLNFIVHCALDAVEEKVLQKRPTGEVLDTYLGLLYPTEEYKIYGYLTNTNIKFILVVDDASVKDDTISRVMKRLHSLYADAFCNPFFALPLGSRKFDEQVDRIMGHAPGTPTQQQYSPAPTMAA
mmetsp:Transcript_19798/g.43037  ORF Transcript_19798/g.43037 Transcript_19798/m.43037 type:complete len:155 (-) Transcript_19798:1229-1693(-)